MAGVVGLRVPLVVVERDRPAPDIEGEVAKGAVIVLPPAVGLLEEGIDEGLDRIADGMRRSLDFLGIAEHGIDEFDLVRWQFLPNDPLVDRQQNGVETQEIARHNQKDAEQIHRQAEAYQNHSVH